MLTDHVLSIQDDVYRRMQQGVVPLLVEEYDMDPEHNDSIVVTTC